jgi:hypothetical protein
MVAPDIPPSSQVFLTRRALIRLAPDEGFAGFALGLQRIEILLQSFVRRFAGVDRAAPHLRLKSLHRQSPSRAPSNRRTADPTRGCR